jgi:restriction endonuclease Mrr
MPIPDFQTLMRPVLSLLSNGEEWSVETIRETLAAHFNLTKKELVVVPDHIVHPGLL